MGNPDKLGKLSRGRLFRVWVYKGFNVKVLEVMVQ